MLSCREFLISETRLRDPIIALRLDGRGYLFGIVYEDSVVTVYSYVLVEISALREHNYLFNSRDAFPLIQEVAYAQTHAPLSQVT